MHVRSGFYPRVVASALVLVPLTWVGCSSPLAKQSTDDLQRAVVDSARRELAATGDATPIEASREAADVQFTPEQLQRLEEDGFYPPSHYGRTIPHLGPDLLDGETTLFEISLSQAIGSAVEQNLTVASARLEPAINAALVTEAEALFDWVFFASGSLVETDRENQVPVVGGIPVSSPGTQSESQGFETGLRRRLTSNGTFEVSTGQTRSNLRSQGTLLFPDPAQDTFVQVDVTQPLLRNLGSEVALADVRLAENAERAAIHRLHDTLNRTVTTVEAAYWDLFLAMRVLQISQNLLDRGIATRDHLENRGYDTTSSQIADARATVEERKADVLRARDTLRQRSDELKRLMNDPRLTVGTEVVLIPLDNPIDEPLEYSLTGSLTIAFSERPEVQLSLLDIDNASIRQRLADNAKLPILDLAFQARFEGLDEASSEAWEETIDGDFASYFVSLNFEQAIGNRQAEAFSRRAQLERISSVVDYRRTLQDVTLDVKTSLRAVLTNYRLIEQARATRRAASESLRTHKAREQLDGLTPTNLDLRFRRQESLAIAEIDEVRSLLDYNTAIAEHYRSMGTSLERNQITLDVEDIPDGR